MSAECRYAECGVFLLLFLMSYAECHYADCCVTECHYADCCVTECHYAECHYADAKKTLPKIKFSELFVLGTFLIQSHPETLGYI